MLTLTKKLYFSCSHQLKNNVWTEEKNREFFGPCANIHGHNYALEVTVKGNPDAQTGMIINLHTIKEIVEKTIIQWVDHKNLNTDIELFQHTLPTIENMVTAFWDKLEAELPPGMLTKLTLYETATSWVEYSKEQ